MEFNLDGTIVIPKSRGNANSIKILTEKALEFEKIWDKKRFERILLLIREFNEKFPSSMEAIQGWELENYCYGFDNSFCWWLEEGTNEVAHMGHDGFNREYGIWFTKAEDKFFTKNGVRKKEIDKETAKTKLQDIKREIIQLLSRAKNNDFNLLDESNILWNQAKTKMLFLYFSDKFIPIVSKGHCEEICSALGIGYDDKSPLKSNHELREFFRGIEATKDWHPSKISQFLYSNIWIKLKTK